MKKDDSELFRLIIERDNEKAKGAIEKFKSELIEMVANAKIDIGAHAIDRMSKAFSFFRISVFVAFVFLGTFGWLSYVSIESTARKVIQTKLDDWLSFEKEGAILKESLEQVRMQMVLNSLVIRLARDKMEGRGSFLFDMSESERTRLIAYMQDPATSEWNFRDAARLLSATYVRYPNRFADIKIDQMIQPIFSDTSFTNEKRLILLESFRNYIGLFEYASEILQAKDAPTRWKIASFSTVSVFNDQLAIDYARQNLLNEKNTEFQIILGKTLAREENSYPLDAWLKTQDQSDEGATTFIKMADEISNQFSRNYSSEALAQRSIKRAANFIFHSISRGASLTICDRIQTADLCFRKNNTSHSLHYPANIFKNDGLLHELASLANSSKFPPDQFVMALTTSSKSGALFGIQLELTNSSLTGAKFGAINKHTSIGTVMLSHDVTDNKIYASYRSPDGNWIRDEVTGYTNFYQTKLRFAFDENFMQSTEMTRFKQMEI